MFQTWQGFKIQTKLLTVFGLLVVIGVGITGWTIVTINSLEAIAQQLIQRETERDAALQARNILREAELAELSYVLTRDEEFIHRYALRMSEFERYQRNTFIRGQSPAFANLLFELDAQSADYTSHVEHVIALGEAGEWETALEQGVDSALLAEDMILKVDEIIALIDEDVAEQVQRSSVQVAISRGMGLAVLIVFPLLSVAVATITSRQIVQPMLTIIKAARSLQEGTFDPAPLVPLADRTDEIGGLAEGLLTSAAQVNARRVALEQQVADLRQKVASVQAQR